MLRSAKGTNRRLPPWRTDGRGPGADYAAQYAAGKTKRDIAKALGVDETTVGYRIKWHESITGKARQAVLDGIIDEGHLTAISGVTLDVQSLHPWLTTDQAQAELLDEVLSKHRGSSAGIKPTVRVVRYSPSD